ncbi:cyclic-di-AMP-binding protein CbpB [Streptococcus loxodontisalivarius]|uniref:Transcriptional regulator n=1 Tax=Streptococcus loxodontisalivarius TaxID=1349415 RepID=A0ABS2PRN1_9STRE|nr:cyclic-di-AMP-binding protein CbpB [Streptococcus loxodontisalivarius]MBM7642370.1 putative transcriptional regulator [Streptococcus loxodontisalivarius]
MIAREFEQFLLKHMEHYLIAASDLAIIIDSHNTDHASLLLASDGYSRVPVITKDKIYVGTIAISDIMAYKAKNQLTDWEMSQLPISKMVNHKIETVADGAELTEVMHKLVDNPFLPVLGQDKQFLGIITRKSILKAVNSLLHDFTETYDIIEKGQTESAD